MKTQSNTFKVIITAILLTGFSILLSCNNRMENMYLAAASVSSFPTGTVIDANADGQADGMDVDGDGIIDMHYILPSQIPATGIDINDDGVADFYMYTTSSGSVLNTKADNTGSPVSVVISNGNLVGYDTSGDGVVDINVTGASALYYSVGGTASGVSSSIIVSLTVNSSSFEYLTISANGAYTFTTNLNGGYFYQVAIVSSTQQCTIGNGTGIIAASDITNVTITCGNYTVGGNISPALTGTMMMALTINNSSTEFLSLSAGATAFTFTSKLNTGAFYNVTIVSSTDHCVITSNTGTIAAASVTGVTLVCSQYTVGGTITPALTATMVLSLSVNGVVVENLTKAAGSANFTFVTKLFDLEVYEVKIVSTSQNCTISSNIGTIATANATGVAINCGAFLAQVQVLAPATTSPAVNLTLTVNGLLKETMSIANGSPSGVANPFSFTSKLLANDIYSIQISSSSVSCSITAGSGTVAANVMADIYCAEFTIGNAGAIAGLTGSVTMSLTVNGTYVEALTHSGVGAFTFATKLRTGDSYDVQIVGTSTDRCKISSNTGTVAAANITSINVVCAQYTVGNAATITGLTGSITLSLSVNGTYTESLTKSGAGAFTFLTKLYNGDSYSVQILSTSVDSCKISADTGTVAAANVTSVNVVCAQYTVGNGATIAGLTGTITLSLSVNGVYTESLTKSGAGAFTFLTKLYDTDSYSVQILSTSVDSCKISSNTGTISAANVTSISVSCSQYSIGGTINPAPLTISLSSNLILALYVNGVLVESLIKNTGTVAGTAYAFTHKVYPSDIYDVQISTSQNCRAVNYSGTVAAANISNANIECGEYTVAGNLVNNTGGAIAAGTIALELQVVSGTSVITESQVITVPGIGIGGSMAYTAFSWKLLAGDSYSVRVLTETLTGNWNASATATGTMGAANVTNANFTSP